MLILSMYLFAGLGRNESHHVRVNNVNATYAKNQGQMETLFGLSGFLMLVISMVQYIEGKV